MQQFFIVRLVIAGQTHDIGYASVTKALGDLGLKALFDHKLVSECSLHRGSMRITAREILTWDVLADQLTANSTTLLRKRTDT